MYLNISFCLLNLIFLFFKGSCFGQDQAQTNEIRGLCGDPRRGGCLQALPVGAVRFREGADVPVSFNLSEHTHIYRNPHTFPTRNPP